jgi:hypothetical protein
MKYQNGAQEYDTIQQQALQQFTSDFIGTNQ